ncbi:hypothetical protein RclHR1_03350014 [Rhizophagus clarus]|uniref:Uncharacterized protein n=1 Tax=Rhizophagus clarus TaxID=94130 RepID=A0A2Z6R9S9_9GLOM|nr:hypothetical protein RclHR1_03350014 [Rhizophagus clarus]GES97168.1 hypothetical protein RCL_jg7046.t1 [Rhizophagus clarus]
MQASNWNTPIMELQSEINITKLQTNIFNNHKVTISIKEQNSCVKIKQNHILEQLSNLFIRLGAAEEDNQSNADDMSDNASQSNYKYSDDTHITRTVYNNGEIIFNEKNLDLPPIALSIPNSQTLSTNISLLQRTAQSFGFGNI